jgi:chromosomal replication initiation ATPase DnaA
MHIAITPTQLEARDNRIAFRRKIAERAAALAETPAPIVRVVPQPAVRQIEIAETSDLDTKVEVVACNGQVVFVGMTEFAETAETMRRAMNGRLTIERIQAAVCRFYQIPRVDILSARRTANIVMPRQIAMYLAKTLTLRSFPEIGRRFGGRDHTTVLHAFRKIEALVGRGGEVADKVEALKQELEGAI